MKLSRSLWIIAGIVILGLIMIEPLWRTSTHSTTVQYQSGPRMIEGFLFRPPHEPAPGILYLHSGTAGFTTDTYAQALANQGYVVLAMNYPGEGHSTGTLGDPTQENQAAIDGIAYLKTLAGVNPQKIGIIGSSHGAGIALKVIESVRLQAAVDAYGGIDARVVCAYWESHNLMGMTPGSCSHFSAEYFAARSIHIPVSFHTPVLILHGVDDTVVPVSQSDQLNTLLNQTDIVHRYLRAPGVGHEFIYDQTPQGLQARQAILAWFAKYLK